MQLAKRTLSTTGRTPSGSVIFFHGSGDTGPGLREWVISLLGTDINIPHIHVIYPTAPEQRYTLRDEELSTVWFNRSDMSIDLPETRKSIAKIYDRLHELIRNEQAVGIPPERIIVGGFSMGGVVAMHTAFHLNTNIAGAFTCSAFLNRDSIVYESLESRANSGSPLPELVMFHGTKDDMIPAEWGEDTYDKLRSLGVKAKFLMVDGAEHELTKPEMLDVQEWIGTKLPPLSGDVRNKL